MSSWLSGSAAQAGLPGSYRAVTCAKKFEGVADAQIRGGRVFDRAIPGIACDLHVVLSSSRGDPRVAKKRYPPAVIGDFACFEQHAAASQGGFVAIAE